jgi:hypothetical protein
VSGARPSVPSICPEAGIELEYVMFRLFAILAFTVSIAACDAVKTVADGFKQAQSVEAELEKSTGVRPRVGFDWNNGKLVSVTVTFPGLYETKPLSELAETVRATVRKNFTQVPGGIILGFALDSKPPGTTAMLQP